METKTTSIQLTNKFIKGLANYELTCNEIVNNGWKYCGGNTGRHLNYFKLSCPHDPMPEDVSFCVCGHVIVENCYITDGVSILPLGNCCIKRFIEKSSRTCEECGQPHKNRKVNKCNECRVGFCDDCGCSCDYNYKKCYRCAFS